MDQDTQNRFDTLRTTDPNAWSPADREFMTARRDYLSEGEKNAFGIGETEPDLGNHVITQDDLDNNPGLAADVAVGDVVQLPANPKPLEDMTKTELTDVATRCGLAVGAFESKASIIERIQATLPQ